MTIDQVRMIIDQYALCLQQRGITTPQRHPPEKHFENNEQMLSHALWMIQEIKMMLEIPEKWVKANRWLGYVQGLLSAAKIYTINELRDDNR